MSVLCPCRARVCFAGVGWVIGNFEYYLLDTPATTGAKEVPPVRQTTCISCVFNAEPNPVTA